MSSRPSLTPWLADFCLSQIATTAAANSTTTASSPPPPPKLVQILSRGGSFWTNNIRTNSLQTTSNNRNNNYNNGIRTGKFDARVVVTDGHHSIVAHLSMACQDLLLRMEALHSTPPGSDPWILFQRGSVGLIHSYQLHTTTTSTGSAATTTTAPSTAKYNYHNPNTTPVHPKSLSLMVDRWHCQPELHGMVVQDCSTTSLIQPVLEHIPIRRALLMINTTTAGGGYNHESNNGNRGDTTSRNTNQNNEEEEEDEEFTDNHQQHIGDPMEVIQNPELLQELMELAVVQTANDSMSSNSGSTPTFIRTGAIPTDIQPKDGGLVPIHANANLKKQHAALDDCHTSEDEEDDDTDDAPVKNLKDMFGMGDDDDSNEGDDYAAEFTQPLQSQPEYTNKNSASVEQEEEEEEAPAPSSKEPDDTHFLLTQPPLMVHYTTAGPPRMVDSSTQTLASTLQSQSLNLRLSIPPPPPPPHPTALTERDITTPTSNHSQQKSPRQRDAPMDAPTPRTLGGSAQSSSSRSKRRRVLQNSLNEYFSTPHSTTTAATTSSVASASSRIRRSYWQQVCEQLDQHAEDDRDVLITVEADSRSRDLLRQGGLSRWLHTNVISMEDETLPSPHQHSRSPPTPPAWVRPPSSMGRAAMMLR